MTMLNPELVVSLAVGPVELVGMLMSRVLARVGWTPLREVGSVSLSKSSVAPSGDVHTGFVRG